MDLESGQVAQIIQESELLEANAAADQTPISSLTNMKHENWLYWLSRGGYNCLSGGYGELFPEIGRKILYGITYGVPVDYEGDRTKRHFGKNPPILPEHAIKVSQVIADDVAALKKAGPFDQPPFTNLFVSPIGAVPKKNSEKIRVIHNLSYPFHGDSVNSGTVHEGLSLSRFGHAARAVTKYGKGCWLVKLDVLAAYKQIPVRREDWHLLGFMWEDKYYYERVLPFGLKSSCRLWEMYATALHFFLDTALGMSFKKTVIHYVDDFLFVLPNRADAVYFLGQALKLCEDLGIPMAADKTEGPTNCLTFLGLELDTDKMMARLPASRLADLQELTGVWGKKSDASVKELQSLVGTLQFACAVVRPGRFYLRRIIDQLVAIRKVAFTDTTQLALGHTVRGDIRWWMAYLPLFSGHSLLYEKEWLDAPTIELFTDACLRGFGGLYGTRWIEGAWSPAELAAAHRTSRVSMPFLELRSLVIAAASFGHLWRCKKITFRCDCMPVVHALAKCSSKDRGMMHQIRDLSTIAAIHGFDFRCEHISGVTNTSADLLSRYGDCDQFRAECPKAQPAMYPIIDVSLPPPIQEN